MKSNSRKKEHFTSYHGENHSLDIYFPDTVYVNELYNGKIIYEGVLDSITTSFEEEKRKRYIIAAIATSYQPEIELEELVKIAKDTFGAVDNRTIPFYSIKFTKVGKNYIHGFINDHVIIDTLARPKTDKDKVRYIENIINFNCAVFVKRKKTSKNLS